MDITSWECVKVPDNTTGHKGLGIDGFALGKGIGVDFAKHFLDTVSRGNDPMGCFRHNCLTSVQLLVLQRLGFWINQCEFSSCAAKLGPLGQFINFSLGDGKIRLPIRTDHFRCFFLVVCGSDLAAGSALIRFLALVRDWSICSGVPMRGSFVSQPSS